MTDVLVSVPDEICERVLDAFCSSYYYHEESHGTKMDFLKMKLCDYVAEVTKGHEVNQAQQAARQAAEQTAKDEIAVTYTPDPRPVAEPEPVAEEQPAEETR